MCVYIYNIRTDEYKIHKHTHCITYARVCVYALIRDSLCTRDLIQSE